MRASRSCSAYDACTLRLRLMRDQLAGKGSRSMIASAVDLARRFQPIERQRIQSREYENIERWIECMDDAAEPLGPVLVFSEKHQSIATGLFPLLAKMERQHAEGRGRRDRGTRGFSAFPGRAFPGRTAGADLLAFFHGTSIVIQK